MLIWSTYGEEPLKPFEEYLIEKYLKNKKGRVLEAGTGSGRISFNIEKKGFMHIDAFDYMPEMVLSAQNYAAALNSAVNFRVSDAVDISCYKDETYDYIVYLQNIISFIPGKQIPEALKESFRVLKKEGIALFSFLNFNGRWFNRPLSLVVNLLRFIYREEVNCHELPWLRYNGSFNRKFLHPVQPRTYWFTREEIIKLLEDTGYEIVEIKMLKEICVYDRKHGKNLFIVCRKKTEKSAG